MALSTTVQQGVVIYATVAAMALSTTVQQGVVIYATVAAMALSTTVQQAYGKDSNRQNNAHSVS